MSAETAPESAERAADLLPCPFCGERPRMTLRPENAAGDTHFAAVACYCGGYSACAHKMATAPEADQAEAMARTFWNRRASLAAAPAPKPTRVLQIGDKSTPANRLATMLAEAGLTNSPAMNDLAALVLAAPVVGAGGDAEALMRHVAAIAHSGGLANLSEAEALTCIRRLSVRYWDGSSLEKQRAAVDAARAWEQK